MARVEIPAPGDLVIDTAGNVLSGRAVTLKNAGTATDATHYSALTAGTSTTAGLVTLTDGTIGTSGNKRYVDEGSYDLTISGRTRRIEAIAGVSAASMPGWGKSTKVTGAVVNGTTDDTAAIQADIDAQPSTGGYIVIPDGGSKITSELTVGLKFGMRIIGANWETSVIQQATDNAAILAFTADNTHSVEVRDVRLQYVNQQTKASHPNSYAVEFRPGGGTFNGFYHFLFQNVKLDKATVGFGFNPTTSPTANQAVWGTTWDRVLGNNISMSMARMVSAASNQGNPCNRWLNTKVLQSGGLVSTDECFSVKAETYFENLDVEGWYNRVVLSNSGRVSFKRTHIEHHHITDAGARIIECLNGDLLSEGAFIGMDEITTAGPHRAFNGTAGFTLELNDTNLSLAASGSFPGGGSETDIIYRGGVAGATVLLGGYTMSNGPGAPQVLQAYRVADRLV